MQHALDEDQPAGAATGACEASVTGQTAGMGQEQRGALVRVALHERERLQQLLLRCGLQGSKVRLGKAAGESVPRATAPAAGSPPTFTAMAWPAPLSMALHSAT